MRYARPIIVTIVFGAIEYALVMTRTGSLPLPTGLNVTVLALPAIAAGILGGAIPGAIVGAIFGVSAWSLATTPLFQNPVISISPRVLIGPAAAGTYALLRRTNEWLALAVAGVAAVVVGTGGVLVLGSLINSQVGAPYISPDAARDVAVTNIPSESLLGAVTALAAGLVRKLLDRRLA
jgi:uncharacterized membrane protein